MLGSVVADRPRANTSIMLPDVNQQMKSSRGEIKKVQQKKKRMGKEKEKTTPNQGTSEKT